MSSRGKDSSSGRAQQETAAVDPVAKRIGRLRALVAGTLGLAAVIVGVGSYLGVDYVERSSAKDHFTSIVEAAVTKLDDNFKKIDTALILLSQAYASRYPALADWPTAVMPNFYSETPLVMEIAGADTIGFAVRVKPEDLVRYESFIFNYWDNDPNIPPDMAGYYSAAGDRGVWAMNDTSQGLLPGSSSTPYHDTTGRTTWGEERRIFALSQVLFTDISPPTGLGMNIYASENKGEALDRMAHCVEVSTTTTTTKDCGTTTQLSASSESKDFLVKTDTALRYVNYHRSVPVVVGDSSQHELVAMVAGQYSWGPALSRIFATTDSGIDVVIRHRGFTLTLRIKEGVAEIVGGSQAAGYGDVASKRYKQYKVHVPNTLQSSQLQTETDEQYDLEMTFYPTEVFINDYHTDLPIIIACSGVMLILLVSMVFVGYDVAVRGQLDSKEIVLDTKRRFVRFVSHEIRTPMNAVRLGMTLFSTELDGLVAKLAGKSSEEMMAVLQTTLADWKKIAVDVLENSEAAVDVLNDLLNYDKIESGLLQLEFSMVPVWNVLQRTFKTFMLQAREKGVVFQLQGEMFDADASLQLVGILENLHCVGDATRITQVLRNLISNSLKFTGKEGTVTVTAEFVSDGLPGAVILKAPRRFLSHPRAGAVRITVEDDGAGLSPAQALDICKEGVQFDVNTLQAGGGSGLGLFIGKGIVEQHGGTMRVSSEGLGIGATFVIELPLYKVEGLRQDLLDPTLCMGPSDKADGDEDKGDEDKGGAGLEEQVPFSHLENITTKYLLVIDDALSNRKLLVRILQGKGYVCREASDGQEAVEVYQQMCADGTQPCALLMDYEMPVMDGPTATKHLREMGCDSFILGVTGNVMQEDVDVFMDAGANAVLAKPLRIEIFESMMLSVFSNKPHPDAVPNRHPDTFKSESAASAQTLIPESALSAMFNVSRRGSKVGVDPDQQETHNTVRQASSVSSADNAHNV